MPGFGPVSRPWFPLTPPHPPWNLYPEGPLRRSSRTKRSTASSAHGVRRARSLKQGADSVGAMSSQAARGRFPWHPDWQRE